VVKISSKVLILSSTVASSRVGASAASFCLQRLGIDTIVLPTTLMGRHPGWGDPGGGAVDSQTLSDVWNAVKKQNIKFDAVLTGYMGHTDHVRLGVEIIDHVRSLNPDALVAVDPVMGDDGRLYICEARAELLMSDLVPKADFITPNSWELNFIQDHLKTLPPYLATSVPFGLKIGVRWKDDQGTYQVSHEKFNSVPHGGGDSLAALFLGQRLLGASPKVALAQSVASVFEIMRAANSSKMTELPLVQMQGFILNATPLDIES